MIRYIKSELYRNRYNRSLLYAVMALTAAAAVVVGVLAYFNKAQEGFSYGNTRFALSNEYGEMGMLFFVVVFLSVFIDGNEKKQHTMKHSVAFGIKRSSIYYARLFVQAILCIAIFLVINVVFVSLSYGLLDHSNEGELMILLRSMLACLPLYLSTLAVNFCFLINLENSATALAYTLGLTVVLPIALSYLGLKVELAAEIAYWLPYNLTSSYWGANHEIILSWNTGSGMLHCYISGLVITIVSSIIGARIFQNIEVK